MNLEDALQAKIVVWFKNNYQMHGKGLIFSVPNGGSRNIIEAKKLKNTGLMAGVADLIVLLPNKTLFIEVKIEKGVQSDLQKQFEQKVKVLGFDYFIVRCLVDFQNIILIFAM
jgi:hypothetical protein